MSSKLYLIFMVLHLVLISRTVNSGLLKQKKGILKNILSPDRYDAHVKPGATNDVDGPTTVYVNMYIFSITNIDDEKMMYSMELCIRQEWRDDRLEFNSTSSSIEYIVLNENRQIWMPDLFFSNEHSGKMHDLMETNSATKIFRDGTVLTSAKVSLVVRCRMTFTLYPMDTQTCSLRIESFRWKADEINLEWKNGTAVSLGESILVPLFNVENYWTERGLVAVDSGEYSVLTLYFKFARRIGHYLVQIYIPCCMAFVVSCLPFWLNPKLLTARVVIGTIVVVSTAMLITFFNSQMPKVAYTKAIDIFTGMTITFIFCALVETVFVHVSESRPTKRIESQDSVNRDTKQMQIDKLDQKVNAIVKMKTWMFEDHATLNDIDAACRALFPICFLFFLFVYTLTCASIQTD